MRSLCAKMAFHILNRFGADAFLPWKCESKLFSVDQGTGEFLLL